VSVSYYLRREGKKKGNRSSRVLKKKKERTVMCLTKEKKGEGRTLVRCGPPTPLREKGSFRSTPKEGERL